MHSLFSFTTKSREQRRTFKNKGVKKRILRTQMRRREARQSSRESTKITSLKEGIVTASRQKRALRMQQSRRTPRKEEGIKTKQTIASSIWQRRAPRTRTGSH